MAGDAVGAVGGYLKEKGVDLLTSTFKGLGGGTLINSFKDTIGKFADKAPSWLIGKDGVFSSIGDLSKLGDPAGLAKDIGGKLIGNAFGGKLSDVSDIITGGLSDIANTLDLKKLATSGITNLADKIGFDKIGDSISSAVSGVANSIGSAGSKVLDNIGGSIIKAGKTALSNVCGQSFSGTIGGSLSSSFDFKNGFSGNISGKVSLGPINLGVSLGF